MGERNRGGCRESEGMRRIHRGLLCRGSGSKGCQMSMKAGGVFENAPNWEAPTAVQMHYGQHLPSNARGYDTRQQQQQYPPHPQHPYYSKLPTHQQHALPEYRYAESNFSSRVPTPAIPSNISMHQPPQHYGGTNGFVSLPGASSHHDMFALGTGNQPQGANYQGLPTLEAQVDPHIMYSDHGLPMSLPGNDGIYQGLYPSHQLDPSMNVHKAGAATDWLLAPSVAAGQQRCGRIPGMPDDFEEAWRSASRELANELEELNDEVHPSVEGAHGRPGRDCPKECPRR